MKELLEETIELDVEESNELLFHVKIEGIDQGSAKIRLVCENNELSYMFIGKVVDRNGLVQFNVPVMKDKLGEGIFQSRIEVLIENKMFAPRFFIPAKFKISFKKAVGIVAEAVDASLNSITSEINVTARPVIVKQKNKLQRVTESNRPKNPQKKPSLVSSPPTQKQVKKHIPTWLTSIIVPPPSPEILDVNDDKLEDKKQVSLELQPASIETKDQHLHTITHDTTTQIEDSDITPADSVIDDVIPNSNIDTTIDISTNVVQVSTPYGLDNTRILNDEPKTVTNVNFHKIKEDEFVIDDDIFGDVDVTSREHQTLDTLANIDHDYQRVECDNELKSNQSHHKSPIDVLEPKNIDNDLTPEKSLKARFGNNAIDKSKKRKEDKPNPQDDITENAESVEACEPSETLKDKFHKHVSEKKQQTKHDNENLSMSSKTKTLKERFKSIDKTNSLLTIANKVLDKNKN